MPRARKKIIFSLFLSCWFFCSVVYAQAWRAMVTGVEYLDLPYHSLSQWSHIHAFRFDLKTVTLSMLMAKDLSQPSATAKTFRKYGEALIAINGGFFNPHNSPLGLRMNEQEILNPLRRISWWGVFFIKHQTAFIQSPNDFQIKKNIEFAVQSGPRLLVNGHVPSLLPGYANRSALGIDQDGKVIMVVTENLPISTSHLAHILKSSPLNCIDALNLDGGSSSQINAKIEQFNLDVPGFSLVTDAVLVKQRR